MLFSEADGRQVVSTATAGTVGKVGGFVVDPSSRRIVALELKKTESGDTLAWEDVAGFGEDAVTVADAERITEVPEELLPLTGKDHRLVGKRLLSDAGDELGKVKDVAFDPETGEITALHTGDSERSGATLLGVGSYAVVVRAE